MHARGTRKSLLQPRFVFAVSRLYSSGSENRTAANSQLPAAEFLVFGSKISKNAVLDTRVLVKPWGDCGQERLPIWSFRPRAHCKPVDGKTNDKTEINHTERNSLWKKRQVKSRFKDGRPMV